METKIRPQTLPGHNYRIELEHGHLFITINHLDGKPFEIFGWLGKAGTQIYGMAEALGKMVSLHLRRDTPVEEIIDQLDGIGGIQPWPNPWLGEGVMVKGIADGFAKCLAYFMENHIDEEVEVDTTIEFKAYYVQVEEVNIKEEPCPFWSMDAYGNSDCTEHISCTGTIPIVEESSEYDPNRLLFTPAPPQIRGKQLQEEMELAEE